MTQFVYSYIDDGADGQELRYSLRGLDRYWIADEPKIMIIGDLPTWAHGIEWVPMNQEDGGTRVKTRNILRTAFVGAMAAQARQIGEVVFMDDDYVLLDYAGVVPLQHGGTWSEQLRQAERFPDSKDWLRTAYRATDRFVDIYPNPHAFELHRPIPVFVDDLVQLLQPLTHREPEQTPHWRTIWGNLQSRYQVWPGRDVRTTGTFPRGTQWVSTDSAAVQWPKVQRELEKMLPTPSRWERR